MTWKAIRQADPEALFLWMAFQGKSGDPTGPTEGFHIRIPP
jgi:hypothetical protein